MDVLLASLVARSATEVAIGAARARSCVALSRRPTMELHKNSIGFLWQRLIKVPGCERFGRSYSRFPPLSWPSDASTSWHGSRWKRSVRSLCIHAPEGCLASGLLQVARGYKGRGASYCSSGGTKTAFANRGIVRHQDGGLLLRLVPPLGPMGPRLGPRHF